MRGGHVVIVVVLVAVVILISQFYQADGPPLAEIDTGTQEAYDSIQPRISVDDCIEMMQMDECEALRTNNPALCDNVPDEGYAAWCKVKITGDNSYCGILEQVEGGYDHYADCMLDGASTEQDCYDIQAEQHEGYEISECLARVTKDTSHCDEMIERKALYCKADTTGDASYCMNISKFDRKWTCLAQHSGEADICEQYKAAYCELHFGDDSAQT